LAFSGGILYLKHGFPSRFNKKVLELYAGKNDRWKRHDECWTKICHVGDDSAPPSFLLWGDSHAGAIAPVFEQAAASSKVSGFVAFKGACAPLLGLKRYDEADVEQCARFHESVLALIESEHIRNVFLHGRWGLYSEGVRYKQEGGTPALITAKGNPTANYSEFEKLLRTTISELRRRNLNVVIIASVPEVGTDVPTELAREAARGTTVDPGPRYSDFMERQARTFRLFSRVAAESAVEVIYPHQLLCDVVSCSIVKAEHALYVDDNHLSVHGAMYLAPLVTPLVKEAAMATRGNGTLSLEAIVILKGLYFP
jgi:hypothetical protein